MIESASELDSESASVIDSGPIQKTQSGDGFLSELDILIGYPVGGRSDIETAEEMLEEFGEERMRRAANWARRKGIQPMSTALRSMQTALRNRGFQDDSSGRDPSANGLSDETEAVINQVLSATRRN